MSNPESTALSPAVNGAASSASSGRAYAAPELTQYGSLQALTASGSMNSAETGGGQASMMA